MTVIIFITVLIILVLVHEFGHFLASKLFGVKVEEFGIGFPPRLAGIKKGETVYSLNALPLGGFVKIFGDEGDNKNDPHSYASRPAWQRAIILCAGVCFNILFAFFIFWIGFSTGFPSALGNEDAGATIVANSVQILQVSPKSPAEKAGIQAGDNILEVKSEKLKIKSEVTTVDDVLKFTNEQKGQNIILTIKRGDEILEKEVLVRENPPPNEGSIGFSLANIALAKYPWYQALPKAFIFTFQTMWLLVVGIAGLLKNLIITGEGAGDIAGPVGIAVMTGQFYTLGMPYLLGFIGLISINLAVLNVLPIPALDGGRLLFVIIEKIKGSPLKQETESKIHAVGFIILIMLILLVTIKDILQF